MTAKTTARTTRWPSAGPMRTSPYQSKEEYYQTRSEVDKRFMQFQLAGECASGWRLFIRTFIKPVEFLMIDVDAYDAGHHVDLMDVPGSIAASIPSPGFGAEEFAS